SADTHKSTFSPSPSLSYPKGTSFPEAALQGRGARQVPSPLVGERKRKFPLPAGEGQAVACRSYGLRRQGEGYLYLAFTIILSSALCLGLFDHYFLTLQQGQLLFAVIFGL